MSGLQATWFFLVGLLLTVYAVLDGFDLGVGFWYLFTKKERDRRVMLSSIGPFWDGNEVWLLTGAGAIFAAFPHVYATVFSGFYLALMLVLFALIFRAVALEFRNKVDSAGWRSLWDTAFGLGSILPALLFSVAVGNILRGVPLDRSMNFAGSFFGLLNPYALLVGLVGLLMIATHGAVYLALRTQGDLADRARRWAQKAWTVYFILFIVSSVSTVLTQPHLLLNYRAAPVLWVFAVLPLAGIALIGFWNRRGNAGRAFAASSFSIVMIMIKTGVALFPRLVPALGQPELSLTIWNASSSQRTLWTMLVLVLIGMPVVIGYSIWTYRVFAGRVTAEDESY